MPVKSSANIGRPGIGNNFNNETGSWDVDETGQGHGKALKTKHFSYYVGNRRWDVQSARVLDKANTTFIKPFTTAKKASLTTFVSDAGAVAGAIKVTDYDGAEAGILGLVVLPSGEPIMKGATAKVITITATTGSLVVGDGVQLTLATGSGNEATVSATVATGNTFPAFPNIPGYTFTVGASPNTNELTIEGSDFVDNFRVKSITVGTSATALSAAIATKTAYTAETSGIEYKAYSLGNTGKLVDLNYIVTDYNSTAKSTDIYAKDALDTVSDPYLMAAIRYAASMGYLSSTDSNPTRIHIPIAESAADTLQIVDSRIQRPLNARDGRLGLDPSFNSTYNKDIAGIGTEGFAYNLSGLVNIKMLDTIFAVYQDRPFGNAGGSSTDYYSVRNNIPYIGDSTGQANSVSFQEYYINGTVMQMGRMFKITKEEMLFGNFATAANYGGGTMLNRTGFQRKLEGLYELIQEDKEIAQQLDIINNAGVVFYAGGALTMKGITKPMTAKTLKQVANRLVENKAEHHSDNVASGNNYGSISRPASWFALTSHRVISTLADMRSVVATDRNNSWIPVSDYLSHKDTKYYGGDSSLQAEQGSIGRFRFISMYPGHEIIYDGNGGFGGGKPSQTLMYNSEYETFEEKDKANYSNVQGYVHEDFETDANGNLVLHMIYVIGKDAISTIKLGGSYSELVTRQKLPSLVSTSSNNLDSADPFDNKGWVAVSWYHGSIAKFKEKIVKILLPVKRA